MKVLLDTHTLLWTTSAKGLLSAKVSQRITSSKTSEILVSSISIWETYKLMAKGKISLDTPIRQWADSIIHHPSITMIDVNSELFIQSCTLPDGFHSDPADQIIVATARLYDAIILTKDQKILDYPHVKSEW